LTLDTSWSLSKSYAMASAADEARSHMELAEKALKPSWLALKFGSDLLTASLEYGQAATKFRAAGLAAESIQAWAKSAELKQQLNDAFGAGRAYESAGNICTDGSDAAIEYWKKAIHSFRLSGKNDIAAKLILKMAAAYQKRGESQSALTAYEDALELYEQDGKDYNLGDVYKELIGFLVGSGMMEEAIVRIDRYMSVLKQQQQLPNVYKYLLSKVVLFLKLNDTVRADKELNPEEEVQGWYASKECEVASELVAAFQNYDAEVCDRLVKDQTFSFCQVEIARIARQLRIANPQTTQVASITADTGSTGGQVAAEPPSKEDELAAMLL